MRERTFVARRSEGWRRFEELLTRVDRRGLRRLEPAQLEELALLYRTVACDLAAAQSRAYSRELLAYLNRLTGRGYVVVHAQVERGGWSRVAHFFAATFPREVRRSIGIIAATAALFVTAWIVAYWLVSIRPANAYALIPAQQIPAIQKSLHDSNFGFDRTMSPAISSLIITNNIRVALLAFAGGMTLGVLTLWEVLNNGLMVGALGALFAAHGFGADFWATIAPHGVIELSSIQIAGGAGMLIAQAILAPGRLRRIDALRANARRAGVLMIGVAALLCIAGLIEGFVTPQRTSELFRFAVGAVTAVGLVAYVGFAGRDAIDPQHRFGSYAIRSRSHQPRSAPTRGDFPEQSVRSVTAASVGCGSAAGPTQV
ncbi:MAG: stage II sporulation protein M [Candidatus Eremiobacteraeota bacterium]|nr:stage II sporulation protein M [Candidatus Eremiobacteraeota bacterium]